jgi:hypothetical protein
MPALSHPISTTTVDADLFKQDPEAHIGESMEYLRRQPYTFQAQHAPQESARATSRSAMASSVEASNAAVSQTRQNRIPPPPTVAQPAEKPTQNGSQPPVMAHFVHATQDVPAESPLQTILTGLETIYSATKNISKRGMPYPSTLSKLYFIYTFPTYKDHRSGSYKQGVEDVLHYYSKALLTTLDPKYQTLDIYRELRKMAATPFRPLAYQASDFPVAFVPRKSLARKSKSSSEAATPSVADDNAHLANQTPEPRGKRPTRTPGKSSLRPVNRAPRKRPRDEFESDAESETPRIKRTNYPGEDDLMDDAADMDAQIEHDAAAAEDDDDDYDDYADALNRDPKSRFDVEPIKLVIRAEKIPDSTPRGPDDMWMCHEEGCGYVVRGGEEEECQERIRQHFRDHEQEFSRVNLAITEATLGHMPIKYAYFPPFLILVCFHTPS